MLHELLLALSGHPSPLFSDATLSAFPAISPAERSLIKTTGHLATTHRTLKTHLARIVRDHPSLICRAAAQSIVSEHLSQFQELILEKEREILRKDAGTVGAYEIVPLAGLLKSFEGWKRRLEWYWDLACVILPVEQHESLPKSKTSATAPPCTGTLLLKSLRLSANTGYPDIEAAAVSLQEVAERVWLRHLSNWVLTGQLSDYGAADFFVKKAEMHLGLQEFKVDGELVPPFLTDDTVTSVMFIGKLLNFLKSHDMKQQASGSSSHFSPRRKDTQETVDTSSPFDVGHMQLLANLETPIRAAALEAAMGDIRRSISNKLVEELLPTYELMRILDTTKDYFLLGHLDFADNLIEQAEKYLDARHMQLNSAASRARGGTDLAGVLMKQGELNSVLSRTWTATVRASALADDHDEKFDWAQEHLRFVLASNLMDRLGPPDDERKQENKLAASIFNDLILSTPAMLTLELESSLSFFLSSTDIRTYSSIHSYLLAIRRGQHRIEALWKQSALRKQRPTPNSKGGSRLKAISSSLGSEGSARTIFMRKIWACSSEAYFVLSELGSYLSDEVVANSWKHFQAWAASTPQPPDAASEVLKFDTPLNMSISSHTSLPQDSRGLIRSTGVAEDRLQMRDIDDLTKAHQQYLSTMSLALLLHNEGYIRALGSVLGLIDQLVAFVERLQQAQHNLDLHPRENDTTLHDRLTNEEEYLRTETTNTSQKLQQGLGRVKDCLNQLATSRIWSRRAFHSEERTTFEPWESGGSLERLMMKLNFGEDLGLQVA